MEQWTTALLSHNSTFKGTRNIRTVIPDVLVQPTVFLLVQELDALADLTQPTVRDLEADVCVVVWSSSDTNYPVDEAQKTYKAVSALSGLMTQRQAVWKHILALEPLDSVQISVRSRGPRGKDVLLASAAFEQRRDLNAVYSNERLQLDNNVRLRLAVSTCRADVERLQKGLLPASRLVELKSLPIQTECAPIKSPLIHLSQPEQWRAPTLQHSHAEEQQPSLALRGWKAWSSEPGNLPRALELDVPSINCTESIYTETTDTTSSVLRRSVSFSIIEKERQLGDGQGFVTSDTRDNTPEEKQQVTILKSQL